MNADPDINKGFLESVFSGVLSQVMGLIFIWTVFDKIPEVHGWVMWEIVFIFALVYLTEGFSSLFGEGTWNLSGIVNSLFSAFLFDKGIWAYISFLSPIFCLYSILIARKVFWLGINKYESVGN